MTEQARGTADQVASVEGRLHALDALRAAMMFLGVLLHAAAAYIAHPAPDAWDYADVDRSVVFDVISYLIHSFRMPVFFAMAGFFSALLILQRGWRGFFANRVQRVVVPFALFALPLWVADAIAMALTRDHGDGALARAAAALEVPDNLAILGHLWFLWYLMVFYLLFAVVVGLGRLVVDGATLRRLGAWMGSPWAPLVPALPLALVLYPLPFCVLTTGSSLVPELCSVLAYGVPFLVGAWLYVRRDLLERLRQRAWPFLCVGIGLVVVNLLLSLAQVAQQTTVRLQGTAPPGAWQAALALGAALATWFLVFGCVGAALRLAPRGSPLVRYAADASYWVYLVHHSMVVFCVGQLGRWRAPAELKCALVVVVVTGIGVVSYHLLVRSTPLGALLNGRRYPFVGPRAMGNAIRAGRAGAHAA